MSRANLDHAAGPTLGDRYQLVSRIGSGASAEVYQATDLRLGRNVAVKQLRSDLSDDVRFAKLFRSEAHVAAQLSHPNILTVFDWSADLDGSDGGAYIVTELLSGGSLRTILDNEGRISLSQAALVGVQTAKGLAAAHAAGLVHRDIKPANLLFGADGRIHIGDFGIARAVAQAAWTEPEGVLIGTARYAAPEQSGGDQIDGLVDVYSLAVCLIEAVNGEVPLVGETALATMMSRQHEDLPVDESFGPLAEPLRRAGASDRSDRCSADEFAAALADACRQLPRPKPLTLIDLTEHVGGPVAVGHRVISGEPDDVEPDDRPGQADGSDDVDHGSPQQEPEPGSARPVLNPHSEPGIGAQTLDPERDADPSLGHDGDDNSENSLPGHDGSISRRPFRLRWIVVAALFAALAVGALFAGRLVAEATQPELASVTAGLPSFEVGDYRSGTVADAEVDAEANRWMIEVIREFVDGTEPDQILSQSPEPGARLGLGGRIELVQSLGPVRRSVPETVGLAFDEAVRLVEEANLAVGSTTERNEETIAAGTVLEASIDGVAAQPGTEFVTGTAIDFVVSAGPAPREVPPLAGLTLEQAAVAVLDRGLEIASTEEYSTSVGQGLVIAVNPEAGSLVPRGATVTVRVSLGLPFVTVPDVTGKPVPEAIDLLQAEGFTVTINGAIGSSVIATRPLAGESVRTGSEIEILSSN